MRETRLESGETVAGKYTIERDLGAGGMGRVLAATHVDLGARVALKVLTVEGRSGGDAVARFLREARAAARLRSEFVAKVTDFGTLDDGRPFMVLEYLHGQDLGEVLAARPPRVEVIDAVCQACAGLAEAHAAGIVHRDLKPSNLFRTRRPDGSFCTKVLDFGISKLVGATPDAALVSTKTAAVLGTPLYMSPEQVRSTRDVDARADVWSLGVVLFEALAGRPPFAGESLGEVFAAILEKEPALDELGGAPPELRSVVRRCLEKRADLRFADVAELATALAPFASDEGKDAARRARATVAEASRTARETAPSLPDLAAMSAETVAAEAPVDTAAARTADLLASASGRARDGASTSGAAPSRGERGDGEPRGDERRGRDGSSDAGRAGGRGGERGGLTRAAAIAAVIAVGGGLAFAVWPRAGDPAGAQALPATSADGREDASSQPPIATGAAPPEVRPTSPESVAPAMASASASARTPGGAPGPSGGGHPRASGAAAAPRATGTPASAPAAAPGAAPPATPPAATSRPTLD